MKALLVGDLHLKMRIILPMIEEKIMKLHINQVILLGDYTDAYEQQHNTSLYIDELDYLLIWKSKMTLLGIEVINLLGNHDVSYLTITPRVYSLRNSEGFIEVRKKLLKLNMQVAFQLDNYLISHAGYTKDYNLEDWHFETISENTVDKLEFLEDHVGSSRGGEYSTGSPLWADFEQELSYYPNREYPKQIVGHTPHKQIITIQKTNFKLIGIDTFTTVPIKKRPFFKETGNGEVLLYEFGKITTSALDWNNDRVFEMLNNTFDRSQRIATLHGIIFDFDKWSITIDNKEIFLTNKEFDTFAYFLEYKGKIISDKDIYSNILSQYEEVYSVETLIVRINEKLKPLLIRKISNNEYIF